MKTLQHKTYDEGDLRIHGKGYAYQFIADVWGENSNLFGYTCHDNLQLASKLKELGAVTPRMMLSAEPCCFYAYFKTKKVGVEFLKKLSAYLSQKARLLDKARAY